MMTICMLLHDPSSTYSNSKRYIRFLHKRSIADRFCHNIPTCWGLSILGSSLLLAHMDISSTPKGSDDHLY